MIFFIRYFVFIWFIFSYSHANELFDAIENDNIRAVHYLLKGKSYSKDNLINSKHDYSHMLSPLHFSCLNRSYASLRYLLAISADPNSRDSFEETPLHSLIKNWRRYMDENGNFYERPSTYSEGFSFQNKQFISLCENKEKRSDLYKMIKCLLDHGADINALCPDGKTPIHLALRENVPGFIIELLLIYGADPNFADSEKNHPLNYAQSAEVVKLLFSYEASEYKIGGSRPYDYVSYDEVNNIKLCISPSAEVSNLLNKISKLNSIDDIFIAIDNISLDVAHKLYFELYTKRSIIYKGKSLIRLAPYFYKLLIKHIFLITKTDDEFSKFIPLILRIVGGPNKLLPPKFKFTEFLRIQKYSKSLAKLKKECLKNESYHYYWLSNYFGA